MTQTALNYPQLPSNNIFKLIEKEVFSKVTIVHIRLFGTLEHESDCIRFTSNSEDDKFLMKHPVVQISAAVLREYCEKLRCVLIFFVSP